MRSRAGVVLLEVMVGLTMLALGAVSLITVASESLRAVARAEEAGEETARASAFLDAVALWPRTDLDRHLGDRREGVWRLDIERPLATLYTVTLLDSLGSVPLLATSLYRPEAPRAAP